MNVVSRPLKALIKKAARNNWLAGFLIVLITGFFAHFVLNNVLIIRLAENHLNDLRVILLSPARPQSDRIAVVLIDEQTLKNMPYRSPVDRALISRLIVALEKKLVGAIGINILFNQPTEVEKDLDLYQRLRDIKIPVVITGLTGSSGFTPQQVQYSETYLENLRTGLSLIYRDVTDHTVRVSLLRMEHQGDSQLGFAAEIARSVGVTLPDRERIFIDYRAAPSISAPAFPVYSASEIDQIPQSFLKNRIVLIGTDLGRSNRLRTPYSLLDASVTREVPGVVIEAHVLSQLIENRTLDIPSDWTRVVVNLLMASIGCLMAMMGVQLMARLFLSLLLLPVAWIGILLLFVYDGAILPMITPTLSYLAAIFISLFWQWRNEILRREKIHRTFGQFMAPAVVAQLLENPDGLELKAELREITILFTDLEGFTELTETTPPQTMVTLLNSYLEEACDIVTRHGGTIDKIVGDALHVMFNAPVIQPDHAQRAVECAIELDQWSRSFRIRQKESNIKLGVTRIGINTGDCVVGNFGGEKRFDYTAHGDAINSAARLEAINQRLGTTICVSESTVKQCHGIYFRSVATLILRGKKLGIKTYLPIVDKRTQNTLAIMYEQAYNLLSDNDPTSTTLLNELDHLYPGDPLVNLHLSRINEGADSTTMLIRKK
ncbi:MAG: adenylate cyclase [Gammaproteobacteria bacterium]